MIIDSYEWYEDIYDKYFVDKFPDYAIPKNQEVLKQELNIAENLSGVREISLRLHYCEDASWFGVETFFRVLKDNLNNKYLPRLRFDGGTTIYNVDDITIDELKYSIDLHLYWIF